MGLESRDPPRFSGFELYGELSDFLESLTRLGRKLKAATKPSSKQLNDEELVQLALFDALTETEIVVLEYWCKAWSNPDIAKELHKTPARVDEIGADLKEKLGARTKLEAVVLAYRLGWIET